MNRPPLSEPSSPVILSVPHAGQDYPARFATMVRLTAEQLRPLEDRHADLLVEQAQMRGHITHIAGTPRCWIDLNRSPADIDPLLTDLPRSLTPRNSQKVRSGLGLIPRRLARSGDIWRTKISHADIMGRVATIHEPWHAGISESVRRARSAFGCALLLDIHSMPSLAGAAPAQIVIGDLFGKSCTHHLTHSAASVFQKAGLRVALNAPYAGGYTLERHGNPQRNVHALQIECDRSLYLDHAQDRPSAGLSRLQLLVAELADQLAEDLTPPLQIAAE